jgi:hypothetical protein
MSLADGSDRKTEVSSFDADNISPLMTKLPSTTQLGPVPSRQPSWIGGRESLTAAERARRKLNAKLANPLAGLTHAALRRKGGRYARQNHMGDEEDIRAFELGAVLAQDPEAYDRVEGLTEEELEVLKREFTNKWSQPKLMYLVIILCSACAAVQGMGKLSVRFRILEERILILVGTR